MKNYSDEFINKILNDYSIFFKGYEFKSYGNPSKEKEENFEEQEKPQDINTMLDKYNDYLALHRMFGDDEYKVVAEQTMEEIKLQFGN